MSFLLDANLLINAFRRDAPTHASARAWLESAATGGQIIYAPAIVEVALLSIMTNARLKPHTAPAADVFQFLNDLHALPNYRRLELEPGQFAVYETLVQSLNLTGSDLNDAYLAALCLTHGLTLVTADSGFLRFPALKVLDPG